MSRMYAYRSTPNANYFRYYRKMVLDNTKQVCFTDGAMNHSTAQVAKLLNIGRPTLHRWIAEGKVSPPEKQNVGGVTVRIWTARDVERVRRYKEKFYRKGRGRKPKAKAER